MTLSQGPFFDPVAETLSQDELAAKQNNLIRKTVGIAAKNNDFFREHFAAAGVDPEGVRGVADLESLPFMNKESFRATYPLGMLCCDRNNLREMHMSSGSTGTPVVMPYTENDLHQWGDCMARCYRMAGALAGDVVQITPSFGLFNGGFGMYHGARQAELFVVPTGSGNTERQIRLAKDFGTQFLTGVVSYGIRLIEVLEKMGEWLPELRAGIFGAETLTDAMTRTISDALGIEVFNIYGMTETGGVGTLGCDCGDHSGIHVWEDQYFLEVIDPATGQRVPDRTVGELVVTSLTREALPVIRFRTGDLTRILSREKCPCGRTSLRIDRISGRTDDMMIIKGVNFFPTQVEQALLEIPGVHPHYQILLEDHQGVLDVKILVEAEEGVTGYMVEKHLKERLGFSPKGDIFRPGELPRTEGKAVRVVKKTISP